MRAVSCEGGVGGERRCVCTSTPYSNLRTVCVCGRGIKTPCLVAGGARGVLGDGPSLSLGMCESLRRWDLGWEERVVGRWALSSNEQGRLVPSTNCVVPSTVVCGRWARWAEQGELWGEGWMGVVGERVGQTPPGVLICCLEL